MAKLGVYYALCPLIDHRSILGINPDAESGVVIVTLGRNIAIKYKLQGQKQLFSWRTKDKFSSPIIYDHTTTCYIAAFNQSSVRLWYGDEENIDKIKKLKFQETIFTIFACNKQYFMVFNNGCIKVLHEALEQRKTLEVPPLIDIEDEYIVDLLYIDLNDDLYVGLIVKSKDDQTTYLLWTRFTLNEFQPFSKLSIQRDSFELNGFVFHKNTTANSVYFLSLWNDGRVFSTELRDDSTSSNIGELFAIIESVSCKYYVSMLSLDDNYIAMYGANCNEEGALLSIYNVQFKVAQTKQEFKLFSKGAKIWSIDNNLFLPVGQNFAVVPFNLETEQLAALVGSHKLRDDQENDISIVEKLQVADWGENDEEENENNHKKKLQDLISTKVQEYIDQGLPEREILYHIIPYYIEQNNIEAVKECLCHFTDFPEDLTVKILKFFLKLDKKSFKNQSEIDNLPKSLQPAERSSLIDLLFCQSFNENLLVQHLRHSLSYEHVTDILKYICYSILDEDHLLTSLNFIDSQAQMLSWSSALIDANYQKIVLKKDKDIGEIIERLNSFVNIELECLKELQDVANLLDQVKHNKPLIKPRHIVKTGYSIEYLGLY